MKRLMMPTIVLAAVLALGPAKANEFAEPLAALAEDEIKTLAHDAEVIEAVQEQNREHANLSQAQIEELDQTWRAQTGSGGALIDKVLSNDLSDYLKQVKTSAGGLYTEIFVTDDKGLNVGQSNVTSDYWQGDETKWKKPFETGSMHIGAVELDESTQTYQSQVSMPVVDPDSGNPIGTVTVGVSVEQLVQ